MMFVIYYKLSITDNDLSYDHLALGLKEALENDKSAFDADRLRKYTGLFVLFGFLLLIFTLTHT